MKSRLLILPIVAVASFLTAGATARFMHSKHVESREVKALAVVNGYETDLGQIQQGTTLTQTVRVENRGERRLFIQPLDSSCRCAKSRSLEIPPGGSEEIQIEFETEGLEGPTEFRTRFQTSAPNLPEFEIQSQVVISSENDLNRAPSPEPLIP